MMSEGVYNRIYEKIVRSDDDLLDLVAYALYKQTKRDWLKRYREDKGAYPDQQSLDEFLRVVQLDSQIASYRRDAESIIGKYVEQVLDNETPEIEKRAITAEISRAAAAIDESTRWWRQIPGGIAAALIYTLLLIAIVIVLRFAGIDLLSLLQQAGP